MLDSSESLMIPTDFCNRFERECIGEYDKENNYKIKCKQEQCQGNFSYSCQDKCAKNEKVCENYLILKTLETTFISLNKLRYLHLNKSKHRHSSIYELEIRKFQEKIPKCTPTLYVWNSSDFCLSDRSCFKKAPKRGSFKENRLKRMECPCKGNLTYICDNNIYCTRNKKACDSFISKNYHAVILYETRLKSIKKCDNDFLLLE